MTPSLHQPAEPFFLATGLGARYCLYHAPAPPRRGALVYLHPFAEEMNKSRRMAALQARALAADGWAILQIDLQGCGDSDGDFADARWEHWKQDVDAARAWLAERVGCTPGLWGLRLGALLALDYACARPTALPCLVLWQPVLDGALCVSQFLRLQVANDMLAGVRGAYARERLRQQGWLDVCGYRLSAELALAIDDVKAAQLAPACPVEWIELVSAPCSLPRPAALDVCAAWERAGARATIRTVAGLHFWSTQEIVDCPPLIEATLSMLSRYHHEH